VLTLHGGDLFDPSKWTSPHRHAVLRFWIRRLLRRATAVVAQSTDTIENVREFYDGALPVVRIPLGIRQPPAGVADRAAFGFEQSDSLLVTLGRLVPRKAVDRLIAIFARMAKPSARLLILGSGPEEPALRRQARMSCVAERIHFFGQVSDVDKFRILRMCDVFVSTSQHEGFGLTFVEAMTCGLPIVCYDCGGQTDFLETGRTGLVLELNDENAFLAACEALMRDRNLRSTLGATSRRQSAALTIEACARDYEALFERARYRRREPKITSGPSSLRPRTVDSATQSKSAVRTPPPSSAAKR
jgi:glycosyltransferase involved in cell wall biosynthesis